MPEDGFPSLGFVSSLFKRYPHQLPINKWLNAKLKALLIDLNGTLHVGSNPTPRAVKAIERLRSAQIPFVFCSNTTTESTRNLTFKLRKMGFEIKDGEVMTSLGACRQVIEERNLKPHFLLSPSAKEEFTTSPNEPDECDTVLIGLHPPSLSYESLNIAFRVLKSEPIRFESKSKSTSNPNSEKRYLIAPHTSAFHQYQGDDNLSQGLNLGIGPFVKALEEGSGIKAEIVGKPTLKFFELALEKLNLNHDEYGCGVKGSEGIGIVGDDIGNDLGEGAIELGLKRILVRTGKYRPRSEDGGKTPPDAIYDTFADFVDDIL